MRNATKTDDLLAFDIAYLKQTKKFHPGARESRTWSKCGRPVAAIRYEVTEDALVLQYSLKTEGSVEQVIHLAWTQTAFDGRRAWLRCGCGNRCRGVFGGHNRFHCRTCHRAVYGSQYETKGRPHLEMAYRIARQVGGASAIDWPERPKHMKAHRYERLEQRCYDLCDDWVFGALGKLGVR